MAPTNHPEPPLKNIPDSGFADDDGSADPRLTGALAAWAAAGRGRGAAESAVLAALADARLLVPVVALLGEAETGPDGLRRDKSSDMAVPTLTAPDGRRALPAFTSTEALARWDAQARPVAVPLRQAIQAAVSEGADTLALDVAGPVPYALAGAALLAAAEGRSDLDPLADPAVTEALHTLLAASPAVVRAWLGPAEHADGTLALVLADDPPGGSPAARAQEVAAALAADPALRARLVRGLDLALLPADAALAGQPFYER
ncbi:SseB family protein [Streptomyces polyrhachis]|uniref:SseB family protein n=1 Tax=Streptomyces polyrhachis TaxID=1282885 RepID=A0ABW2GEQ0_9ACTN